MCWFKFAYCSCFCQMISFILSATYSQNLPHFRTWNIHVSRSVCMFMYLCVCVCVCIYVGLLLRKNCNFTCCFKWQTQSHETGRNGLSLGLSLFFSFSVTQSHIQCVYNHTAKWYYAAFSLFIP